MVGTMRVVRLAVLTLLGCVAGGSAAFAQVTTADVLGRVTDANGGALPGATVTITNPATGDTRAQVTGDTGDYTFTFLPIGRYDLSIQLQGFGTVNRDVQVSAGDRFRVDAQLVVGAVAVAISVTAQAPLIQSGSATMRALFTEPAVQDLPLPGRNVMALPRMAPGANEGLPNSLSSGNRPDDRRQTSTLSVNGQNDVLNNNLIDGVDNNERFIGTIGVRPSLDAIAEGTCGDEHLHPRNRPNRGRGREHRHQVGHQRFQRLGLRVLPPREVRWLRPFRAPGSTETAPAAGAVGRQSRRARHPEPDVLLRRLRALPPGARPDEGQHRADGGDAQWRLLGARRRHLRSADVPTDALSGQRHPGQPHRPGGAAIPESLSSAECPGLGSNFTTNVTREQTSHTFDLRLDHHFTGNRIAYVRYSDNAVETLVPGVFGLVNGVDAGGAAAGFGGPSITDVWGLHGNYLEVITPRLLFEAKVGKLFFDSTVAARDPRSEHRHCVRPDRG